VAAAAAADLTGGVVVAVGGLDGEPGSHLCINEAAVRAGVPRVSGGRTRTQLVYCSVDPRRSRCLQCNESGLPEPREATTASVAQRLVRARPSHNALIGPLTMQVGSLVA
jgi:hypothetical protein